MAVQLEQDIMREIGLGDHFSWSNGSGSCERIRKKAAKELPEVLQKYHADGKEVAPPNDELCSLLKLVADCEENQYMLTKTWQAASDVILAHLYLYHAKDEKAKQEIVDNFSKDVIRSYLPMINIEKYDKWR